MKKNKHFAHPTNNQTYYITFDKRRCDFIRWWYPLIDNDYLHITIMMKVGNNRTLIINPLYYMVYMEVVEQPIEICIDHFLSLGVTSILKYTVDVTKRKKNIYRGFYTCVTLTKALLNVNGFSISPKQLHKRLIEDGAIKINRERFHGGGGRTYSDRIVERGCIRRGGDSPTKESGEKTKKRS